MAIRTKLSAAQAAFCEHYALHGNASDAYRRSYPKSRRWKPANLHSKASNLLKTDKVQARILELSARIKGHRRAQVRHLCREDPPGAAIAFANSDDYYLWGTRQQPMTRKGAPVFAADGSPVMEAVPFAYIKPSSGLTRAQKAAIVGADMSFTRDGMPMVAVKIADKRAALKDLGQHLGLFKQDLQVTGGAPIAVVLRRRCQIVGNPAPVDAYSPRDCAEPPERHPYSRA